MAEFSKISWTDHTVNGWIGCSEVRLAVSPELADKVKANGGVIHALTTIDGRVIHTHPSECDNCYAKFLARNRMGYNGHDEAHPVLWGNPKTTPRHRTKYVHKLLPKLQAEAAAGAGRQLVFSFSLSDVFEEHPMLPEWRRDFFELVERCPDLDFQVLTKRPQNILRMVPDAWKRAWPRHVWIGTSAGTQAAMDRRAPYMADLRAAGAMVAFLSMEPLLERTSAVHAIVAHGVNWVITGGESGAGEDRPRIDADKAWFYDVLETCELLSVPFFHKQHGGPRPGGPADLRGRDWHQFPDTGMGRVGGVRALPGAELLVPALR